ncbi:hypothetical protein P2P98_14060 [Microbacterium sp. Kw_RZR3]|uniref:hypothetical protein n=1 Tax=Microbacterium sp. Kw_RZR3 TaxID=3032903 RepID=UPI0023DB4727|nr:hypothetical protein [Microbacterium sp. Kw_RZR3]MDF2047287.1 hypothetical protein [Microbacterium sp. Kw_RZR3]
MTDARLRGEWLTAPAHDGLTDAAYRVLHNALMHSNEQGTDGAITNRELRFLYPGSIAPTVLKELEAAGFWEQTPTGYQLLGWSDALGQSSAEEVERQRARNREKQARWREKHVSRDRNTSPKFEGVRSSGETGDNTGEVTGYETGDVTGVVGQDRTGPFRASPALKERGAGGSKLRALPAKNLISIKPGEHCPSDQHRFLPDGTCMRCDIRPGGESA